MSLVSGFYKVITKNVANSCKRRGGLGLLFLANQTV